MRKFKELSKNEKIKAFEHAIDEAMGQLALGKININYAENQIEELYDLLEPIAQSIAEEAFYPDVQDVIINLWE